MRDSLRGCLLAILLFAVALAGGGVLGIVTGLVVDKLTGNRDLSFASFMAVWAVAFLLIISYGSLWLFRSEDHARWHDSGEESKLRNLELLWGLVYGVIFGLWGAIGDRPAWAVAIVGAGVGAAVGHDFKRRYYDKMAKAGPLVESTAPLTKQDAEKAWTQYRRLRRLYGWSATLFIAALAILFFGVAIAALPINLPFGNAVESLFLIATVTAFCSLIVLLPSAYFFKYLLEIWQCPQCGKHFGLQRIGGYPHRCEHCGFAIPKKRNAEDAQLESQ